MTQKESILKWLKTGRTITQLDALREFSCMRLAARIGEIKKKGYDVCKEDYTYVNFSGTEKTIAKYSLK